MLYLSQILKSKVKDSSDQVIGQLRDILISPKAGTYSPLAFLLIKGKGKKEIFLPFDYVENMSHEEITLKKIFSHIPQKTLVGEYTYLNRDVLDQQIVDVAGARVVRVNDLKLGLFEDQICVLGVDISFKGLLRRLGFGRWDFMNLFKVNLIDWRKTQPVKGTLKLDTISKTLAKLHPADLANIVEKLSARHGTKLVKSLNLETAAQVIKEMNPTLQKSLVSHLGLEKTSQIIDKMPANEIVDLVQFMPKQEAKKFLSSLHNDKLKKIDKLIHYNRDTAGSLMITSFISGRPEWTVSKTIAEIKRLSPTMHSILYIYVTNKKGMLKGVVSLRRLLTANPDYRLVDLIKKLPPVSTLKASQKVDDIIKVMTKYNLYTAAVLDDDNKLLGVVTVDDVMRYLEPNA